MRFRLVPGIVLGIALGLAVGEGAYTFVYAQGYSYMTDNAEACVNCHVMRDQYSAWLKSSDRAVGSHPGVAGKETSCIRCHDSVGHMH